MERWTPPVRAYLWERSPFLRAAKRPLKSLQERKGKRSFKGHPFRRRNFCAVFFLLLAAPFVQAGDLSNRAGGAGLGGAKTAVVGPPARWNLWEWEQAAAKPRSSWKSEGIGRSGSILFANSHPARAQVVRPSRLAENAGINFTTASRSREPKARITPAWYDTSWTKRKPVTIAGSSAGLQTNYQVRVTVAYDPSMRSDFADIRFTGSDGTTLLPLWLETKTDSATADFWVKVPGIPAAPGTVNIYMYYGNSDAESISDGAGTFVSGTDFSRDDGFSFRENGVNESYGSQAGALRTGLITEEIGSAWTSQLLLSGGRLDSIEYLGDGVLVAGSRSPNPGHVFRSFDYGKTWRDLGDITGSIQVTTIKSAGQGVAYLLTSMAHLWKTTDYGLTWGNLGKISHNTARSGYALSYGLLVTSRGTVLVADTGGHIFRSADGGSSWSGIGLISSPGLYRFDNVGDGEIVNGWAGRVFKSTDDGVTWKDKGQLINSPLYATEYAGNGIVLQASDSGHIFRSTNNGETWTNLGDIGDGADDFAALGNGIIVYATYNGNRHIYRSTDSGATWSDLGPLGTAGGDSLEHVISVNDGGHVFGIGGTHLGYIVRSEDASRAVLRKIDLGRTTDSYARKPLPGTVSRNFAVRFKVKVLSISGSVWYPIIAISTTGTQAASSNNSYALALIQRGTGGFGLVEFKGANQNPNYAPTRLTELDTSFGITYVGEIRKTSATSASLSVFREDGALVGSSSIDATDQNYAYLMAQISAPADWSAATSRQDIDYLFLRNYVSPEPAASVGAATSLGPQPVLLAAASRLDHAGAGVFDLPLDLSGAPTVEPRRRPDGTFTIVLTFDRPIVSALSSLTAAFGTISATEFSGDTMILTLSGVLDAQALMLNVAGVEPEEEGIDGSGSIIFKVLQGDANGDGSVSQADVDEVKAKLSRAVNADNASRDVNASGTLNTGDVLVTKSRLGNSSP